MSQNEVPADLPREAAQQPVPATASPRPSNISRRTLVLIVLTTIVVTAAATWLVRTYLFPGAFRPVELSVQEAQVLDAKLTQLGANAPQPRDSGDTPAGIEPVPYQEDPARRALRFSERELNALLARDTNLAERVAIDLSDNLASLRLLIPMEPDFPLVGGRTLRIDAGLELAFRQGRPVAILRGVSLMGVPIPEAWLGNLKNVDLVQEFGSGGGFWQAFAAGVEDLEIVDGALSVKLKE